MPVVVVNQENTVQVFSDGAKGQVGDPGTDGVGFEQASLLALANPLVHLFKTNKIVQTLVQELSWDRASEGAFIDRNGRYFLAPADEFREEKEGFLFEIGITNYCLHSTRYDDPVWIKQVGGTGVATVTPDVGLSPAGTTDADRVQLTIGGSTSLSDSASIRQLVTVPADDTYTGSVWIKSNTGVPQDVVIELDGSSDILTVGVEWQKIEKTAAVTGTADFIPIRARGSQTQDVDVLVWVSQIERNAFSTSAVITSTVSASRNNDIVIAQAYQNIPNSNQPQSIACQVTVPVFFAGANMIWSIGDLSADYRLYLNGAGDGTAEIRADWYPSAGFAINNPIDLQVSNTLNILMVFDGAEGILYLDGVEVGRDTGTQAGDDSNLTSPISFAQQSGFGSFLKRCHIKDFRIYDFALSAEQAALLHGGP